jgi:hypothetical protein
MIMHVAYPAPVISFAACHRIVVLNHEQVPWDVWSVALERKTSHQWGLPGAHGMVELGVDKQMHQCIVASVGIPF